MLAFFTILIMGAVGYAYWREGLFTACVMCVNTFAAGLVAFNFFEPIADLLDPLFNDSFAKGYEDGLVLVILFCLTLGLLRLATHNLAPKEIEFHAGMLRGGGAFFGLITGYLVCGFLICVLQTLPWHENFMGFDPKAEGSNPFRRVLPPDRVWLALMSRAGAYAFSNNKNESTEDSNSLYERYQTFDRKATFELRYARYRRYTDAREPLSYLGECEAKAED